MKLRYSVVAVAVACSLSSMAWADEAAAKKWIDNEFQPSTLSKAQQTTEMKWFIDAAKKTSGQRREGNFGGVGNHCHP
jgi:glycerol transport system substrate-binding protein